VAFDSSYRQLQHSRRIDDDIGISVPVSQATVSALPFADASFDLACSAFGALSFVVDIAVALREVRRVLRPGGRFVFSVVHPSRWMFPDDPTTRGLTVTRSYFDRTPYVETDEVGRATYVEPHHTMADWMQAIADAELALESLIEPEWPTGHDRVWGGWGPERGVLIPGTLILTVAR
jgi:SAM-dependent methyltransferase